MVCFITGYAFSILIKLVVRGKFAILIKFFIQVLYLVFLIALILIGVLMLFQAETVCLIPNDQGQTADYKSRISM
jgi:hypothetical protein